MSNQPWDGTERRKQTARQFLFSPANNALAILTMFLVLAVVAGTAIGVIRDVREFSDILQDQAIVNEIAVLEHQIRQEESHACIVNFIEDVLAGKTITANKVDSCRTSDVVVTEIAEDLQRARDRLLEHRQAR